LRNLVRRDAVGTDCAICSFGICHRFRTPHKEPAMTSLVPATTTRVQLNTAEEINAAIQRRIERNVAFYANASPEMITERLHELDEEWDIERMLEANAASVSLLGVTLGLTSNRIFFLLPGVVAAFLLQHAVQGWCPPVPILRRMGFRTSSEIDTERYALKALRGDFDSLRHTGETKPDPNKALAAAKPDNGFTQFGGRHSKS
jgi:hypothetical protein